MIRFGRIQETPSLQSMIRRTCLVCIWAISGTVFPASPPDAYEAAPYNDSTSETTANVLYINSTAQAHTIHEATDVDWGICPISSSVSSYYSLHFTNLVIPTGSALLVDIYADGIDQPPVADFINDDSLDSVDMGFVATGITQICYSVSFVGAIDPSVGYSLQLHNNCGCTTGHVTATGPRTINFEFDTWRVPAPFSVGFDIMRSPYSTSPVYAKINTTPIPIPATRTSCPGAGCVAFTDTGLKPGTIYLYQVMEIRADDTTTLYTSVFSGSTLPSQDDSDGDGLIDTTEDTNKSGTFDAGETNLYGKDTDGDGFEDGVEAEYGSAPLITSSTPPSGFPFQTTADADSDGYKDYYEYALGYNPSSSSSRPPLADIDGSAAITGADAIILKRVVVGTLDPYNYTFNTMDLNRDGLITGADAVIMQRFVVQTITALPTN